MKAAIYYPYLQVQTHGLMKHALLFWDQLEVITPFDKIDLPNDKELAVASELLVKPCNPSDTQKEQAHIQLMDLVSRPLPAWFYIGSEQPKDWIYADKFFRKTWDELQKRGLALAQSDNEKHYWSSKALGMLMMSVLADCCAGKTKVTATDQPDAYNTLGKCLAVEVGAEARHPREGEGALVSTEVLSPSLDAIPFANLIKLRKQESDKNGYQYKQLRHNLFARIASFSEELSNPGYNESDRAELKRQFKDTFDAETADLRNELGIAGRGWPFSTDMKAFVSLLVKAGVKGVTGDFAGSLFALGAAIPLVRMTDKYNAARFKALNGHFSAYLYLVKHARFEANVV